MDGTALTLASTFGFGAANMTHALTPNLGDVRAASSDDDDVRAKVRTGEAAATLIVGATGIVLWKLTGETLPLVLSGTILGLTFLAYEYALRQPKPSTKEGVAPMPQMEVLRYG